jgi:hypothetical protein
VKKPSDLEADYKYSGCKRKFKELFRVVPAKTGNLGQLYRARFLCGQE